jgi:hypothetical protein
MGKAVDEIPLQPVKLPHLLVVYEYDEHADHNDPHQDGDNKNDDPCLDLEKLTGIKIMLVDELCQPRAYLDVPINIEDKRRSKGKD